MSSFLNDRWHWHFDELRLRRQPQPERRAPKVRFVEEGERVQPAVEASWVPSNAEPQRQQPPLLKALYLAKNRCLLRLGQEIAWSVFSMRPRRLQKQQHWVWVEGRWGLRLPCYLPMTVHPTVLELLPPTQSLECFVEYRRSSCVGE